MIFVAILILPFVAIANIVLIGYLLYAQKISPISVVLCIVFPITAHIIYDQFISDHRGGILSFRNEIYYLVQTIIQAVTFIALQVTLRMEKDKRINYYRDPEENEKEEN